MGLCNFDQTRNNCRSEPVSACLLCRSDGEKPMPTPSKRQVPVVDDDPDVRDSLAQLLNLGGYDVAAAEDGVVALFQLSRSTPDAIVSDLNMPRMSGVALLSEIRRRFPQIVTIATSGAYRSSGELPPEVIADGSFAKGDHPTSLFWNAHATTSQCSTAKCGAFDVNQSS